MIKTLTQRKIALAAFILTITIMFSSCLTAKKMDRFIAKQYNNELPKVGKKSDSLIIISSKVGDQFKSLSMTDTKTTNMLPLIVYWQWNYNNTCTLNSQIFINSFTKTLNTQFGQQISQKLNGQKLELTVEEVPRGFKFEEKVHVIFLLLAYSTWERIELHPEKSNLVVSYKTTGNGTTAKTGKILIKNLEQTRGLRFFQTINSAISEYIREYNSDITIMTKSFARELIGEL